MQIFLGWIALSLGGLLFVGQLVSSLNFGLAQKLGFQENPEFADAILQRSEQYTAYWDIVTLGWFPLAGILMITNHDWWQIISLIGASIYFDTSGREAAKILCFRHEGFRTGTTNQQRLFFATYLIMAGLAILVISYSLYSISQHYRI